MVLQENCLDVTRINSLGWSHNIGFEDGLTSAYQWYLGHLSELRLS